MRPSHGAERKALIWTPCWKCQAPMVVNGREQLVCSKACHTSADPDAPPPAPRRRGRRGGRNRRR